MFIIMVVVFVLGYLAIALEHPLHIDKAVPALAIGYTPLGNLHFRSYDIFSAGLSEAWNSYAHDEHGADGEHGISSHATFHR